MQRSIEGGTFMHRLNNLSGQRVEFNPDEGFAKGKEEKE